MKFSHALKFNANPSWKDYYINYNGLKKLIYKAEAQETKGLSLTMPELNARTSLGTSFEAPCQQPPCHSSGSHCMRICNLHAYHCNRKVLLQPLQKSKSPFARTCLLLM
jgi:hypothetical protein